MAVVKKIEGDSCWPNEHCVILQKYEYIKSQEDRT